MPHGWAVDHEFAPKEVCEVGTDSRRVVENIQDGTDRKTSVRGHGLLRTLVVGTSRFWKSLPLETTSTILYQELKSSKTQCQET